MQIPFRLLRVLRRGPRHRRVQASAGLILIAAALVWVIAFLWKLVLALALLLGGFYLIRRSLRDSARSS